MNIAIRGGSKEPPHFETKENFEWTSKKTIPYADQGKAKKDLLLFVGKKILFKENADAAPCSGEVARVEFYPWVPSCIAGELTVDKINGGSECKSFALSELILCRCDSD